MDLGGTLSYTGTSQGATAAGTYVIEPTGITSSNYSITFVAGSLTIIVGDSDGDGVRDPLDNCPTVANASQADADGDGIGDVCDNAPNTPNADQRDTDRDGIGDVLDTDDDNDGCQDTSDAFPLDPSECSDNDGDGTGDNADTDDDNDGVPDSIDNCPFTPNTNQSDIDSDGIGDVCDNDIDGDGWSNEQEQACGSDATEATDTLTDFDNDGLPDCSDPDDDNDGFEDQNDAFPLDPNESKDSDNDGIGDNADLDDNNDGFDDEKVVVSGLLTPNSSGMERTWKIVNIDQYPTSRVSVFDKNGLEVFSAQNYRNDWSGTYKNTTNPLPAGSYIYRLSLGDGNPAKEGWIYIQY